MNKALVFLYPFPIRIWTGVLSVDMTSRVLLKQLFAKACWSPQPSHRKVVGRFVFFPLNRCRCCSETPHWGPSLYASSTCKRLVPHMQ